MLTNYKIIKKSVYFDAIIKSYLNMFRSDKTLHLTRKTDIMLDKPENIVKIYLY